MLLARFSHSSTLFIGIKYLSRTPRIHIRQSSNCMMASSIKAQSGLILNDSEQFFIYGTAWKKDQTKQLVKQALKAGFRKVDTAAQPRHYREELVGAAVREVMNEGKINREDIYVQTKYTTPAGQDLNDMPYHPLDPLNVQIHTSVESSLRNFRSDEDSVEGSYIDCLLLHSPLPTIEQTLEAWRLLETYVPAKAKTLGISNVTLPVLRFIYENSTIKPSVVQNRFISNTSYDASLREFCHNHDISYQSFWTLTGNPELLRSEPVMTIAKSTGMSASVVLYSLVANLGIVVLNGTKSVQHMEEDLSGIKEIREWAAAHQNLWLRATLSFRDLVEPK